MTARVWLEPEKRIGSVMFHPRWMADNFSETAGFDTQEEAVHFSRVHWRLEPKVMPIGWKP